MDEIDSIYQQLRQKLEEVDARLEKIDKKTLKETPDTDIWDAFQLMNKLLMELSDKIEEVGITKEKYLRIKEKFVLVLDEYIKREESNNFNP